MLFWVGLTWIQLREVVLNLLTCTKCLVLANTQLIDIILSDNSYFNSASTFPTTTVTFNYLGTLKTLTLFFTKEIKKLLRRYKQSLVVNWFTAAGVPGHRTRVTAHEPCRTAPTSLFGVFLILNGAF